MTVRTITAGHSVGQARSLVITGWGFEGQTHQIVSDTDRDNTNYLRITSTERYPGETWTFPTPTQEPVLYCHSSLLASPELLWLPGNMIITIPLCLWDQFWVHILSE